MISFRCPECERRLRVDAAHRGRKARCPTCRQICQVPQAAAMGEPRKVNEPKLTTFAAPTPATRQPEPPTGRAPASTPQGSPLPPDSPRRFTRPSPRERRLARQTFLVQAAEGTNFGPVQRGELDQWVEQGRVRADDRIVPAGSDDWEWARDAYPELADGAPQTCLDCGAPQREDATVCSHCQALLSALAEVIDQVQQTDETLQEISPPAPPAVAYTSAARPVEPTSTSTERFQLDGDTINNFRLTLLIAAVSNVVVGLLWSLTFFGIVFLVPLLFAAGFEVNLYSKLPRLSRGGLIAKAKPLACFEILVGLVNPICLVCGVVALVNLFRLKSQ